MSLTRAQLRASLRYTLADQAVWKDTQLNAWIADAIRDYSSLFPRQIDFTLDCAVGGRYYSLQDATVFGTTAVIAVTRVEYPAGLTPPRFLSQLAESSPSFFGGPYYDVQGDPPIRLVLGEPPQSADDDIILRCSVVHVIPLSDSTALSLPDHHLELLRAFVIWKAAQYLEGYAAIDPGRKAAMIAALGKTAAQAEKYYYWQINRSLALAGRSGPAGRWTMDDHDRVY